MTMTMNSRTRSPRPKSPGLSVENLSVEIEGQSILSSVDIDVPRGSLSLVTGRSGAGKSTLANAILGLVPIADGHVRLDDVDLASRDYRGLAGIRCQVGVIYQESLLLADLTVEENVIWVARLRGYSVAESRDLTREALCLVGVQHLARRRIHHLSGGEAQRVSVARAAVGNPLLIVADEPTSALDSDNSKLVANLLADIAKSRPLPVVVASHDPILIDFADNIVTLHDGQIIPS